MLSFFPAPYPDELWYSVLSRYFAYSGYFAKCRNNSVNRDLLGNRMRRYVPFYGTNLNNFLTQLPNNFITADEIILQHTLSSFSMIWMNLPLCAVMSETSMQKWNKFLGLMSL